MLFHTEQVLFEILGMEMIIIRVFLCYCAVFGNGYEVQKEEKVSCADIYLNRGDHYDIKFQAKGCSSR